MSRADQIAGGRRVYGVAAQFDSPAELLAAIRELRERGHRKMDAYTPYPVHGLSEALALRRSALGWFALAAGLA
ncbi:MAG: quinol:electron acceptor oxidoreductase subunit ActD, partial [Bryobacteraceae bacterium]